MRRPKCAQTCNTTTKSVESGGNQTHTDSARHCAAVAALSKVATGSDAYPQIFKGGRLWNREHVVTPRAMLHTAYRSVMHCTYRSLEGKASKTWMQATQCKASQKNNYPCVCRPSTQDTSRVSTGQLNTKPVKRHTPGRESCCDTIGHTRAGVGTKNRGTHQILCPLQLRANAISCWSDRV